MKQTHFFLGANSAEGFYGLYDQLLDAKLYDLIILKGTPGCGKSTFMRRVAAALEERGLETVYIHCSGDPDSLDGVIAPAIRTAIVDGTAPHVLEPRYALAHERYVDLSQCCDSAAAKEVANGLTALTDAYRASYREAYHVLRALGGVDAERRALVSAHFDEEKLLKGGGETRGRAADVFLGGLTCQGKVCRFDSVDALCPRVYELCDSYGLAAPVLRRLRDAALEAGEDILTCRDPLRPAEIAHLLIPARGLAFVTTGEGVRYEGKPYRRLRVDAMAEEKLTRAEKAHLRFIRRVRRALEEEAVASLKRAKRGHDALEALYRPCVDFDAVGALCDAEIARIGAYPA